MIRIATKLPRPTVELIRSVQQVGELLDVTAHGIGDDADTAARFRICAATCYQAAHRLQELATLVEEIAPMVDTRTGKRSKTT